MRSKLCPRRFRVLVYTMHVMFFFFLLFPLSVVTHLLVEIPFEFAFAGVKCSGESYILPPRDLIFTVTFFQLHSAPWQLHSYLIYDRSSVSNRSRVPTIFHTHEYIIFIKTKLSCKVPFWR